MQLLQSPRIAMAPELDLFRPLQVPSHWKVSVAPLSEWIAWSGQVMEELLARLSGRPVRLTEIREQEASAANRPTFWFQVLVQATTESNAPATRITVTIDVGAARAIIDGLLAALAGFRSDGALLDTDRAVLEYVVLELVDAAVLRGGFRTPVTIEALGSGEPPQPSRQFLHARSRLAVGALGGEVAAMIEAEEQQPIEPLPARLRGAIGRGSGALPARIDVALRAPFLIVAHDDWNALAPGDLLLSGISSLDGCGLSMRLTTEAGWSIASARVTAHGPAAIEAETLDPCIEPDDPVPPRGGRGPLDQDGLLCLRPLVAATTLSASEYAAIAGGSGQPMRVVLSGGSGPSVRLCLRDEPVGRAELVRFGGEVAYRLIEVSSLANTDAEREWGLA